MMLSEKTLEDSIEANFPGFANFVQRSLQFIGRQYETTVGPIDILARDKKTGGYVVIELKKGRAAAKVFGPLSRYMGWVKKNLAGDAPVRSEEHTSELQSLIRISYAVFSLTKQTTRIPPKSDYYTPQHTIHLHITTTA